MCRLTLQGPDVVAYAFSASIWELEAGGSLRLGGQLSLHCKFHAMATWGDPISEKEKLKLEDRHNGPRL